MLTTTCKRCGALLLATGRVHRRCGKCRAKAVEAAKALWRQPGYAQSYADYLER